MGAYSPSRLINDELKKIINKIIKPTLNGLENLRSRYKGFPICWFNDVDNEPFNRVQCKNGRPGMSNISS